jgi:hypothetical protein
LPNKVSDGDQGDKTLEFDNETISMPVNVYNLYVNVDVRQNIYNILQPLESDGIDTFSAGNDICVTKAELPYFYPPRIEKTLHDNTQELTVIIESIVFKENNKWRFNNGTLSFSAAILDKDFLAQVDNGQRFAKGDWLRVQLQTVQIDENNTLKSIYNIVKVIKHETREQTKMQV